MVGFSDSFFGEDPISLAAPVGLVAEPTYFSSTDIGATVVAGYVGDWLTCAVAS